MCKCNSFKEICVTLTDARTHKQEVFYNLQTICENVDGSLGGVFMGFKYNF